MLLVVSSMGLAVVVVVEKGVAEIECDSTGSVVAAGEMLVSVRCCCLDTSAAELACTLVVVQKVAKHSK